jgi:hypothetical protein
MADLPVPAAIMGDVRQLIEDRKYGLYISRVGIPE